MKKPPPIPFHPSYGYATKEQIAELMKPIPPSHREIILKQIEKQTKNKGKLK